jgi:hypothetical protein
VKFTLCSQNSPNESNIEEEHTLPTTHVQHFSAEFFIYLFLESKGLVIFIFIFQNFSNWGISMQNRFCIVHL